MDTLSLAENSRRIELYVPDPVVLLKSDEATRKYVNRVVSSGGYLVTPDGFLPGELDEFDGEEDCRFVVAAAEEDIAPKVNSNVPLITTLLGMAYPDGGECSSFVFKDAIVEYRENIGIVSTKASKIPGKVTSYMESYASVGFPTARFQWIKSQLEELHGLKLTDDPKITGTEHNGRLWFTANITGGKPTAAIVKPDGTTTTISIFTLMGNVKKSLRGNVCVSLSLKRVVVNGVVYRGFSVGLKHMQVLEMTDDRSPGLANAVEFRADVTQAASSALLAALNNIERKAIAANPATLKIPEKQIGPTSL
ncbi:hypothetical protein DFH28DRAFT_1142715 [Melampsora americana]|nr:hypothetical protein DFH28DRAFT_1142715 [Melampsora americana]